MAEPLLFLSYGRADAADLAEGLARDLAGRGYGVWQDVAQIRAPHTWDTQIEAGIRTSAVMVALLSPHAVRRDGDDSVCLDEIAFARFEARIPIVPVMAVPCAPPLLLVRSQWVPVGDYGAIAAAVERALAGDVPLRAMAGLPEPWDFGPFLWAKRRHFTGRGWLFDRIEAWRRDGPGRALLVTGAPGSGKSAFMAELIQGEHGGGVVAYHCCQADTPATIEPGRFVQSIAAMLAARLDGFADLVASDPAIAEALTPASTTGDPASAFEAGVLAPLHRLAAPAGPCLLAVDALDEALGGPGLSIVDVLGARLEHFPAWLRLVASTRPDSTVRARLGRPPEVVIAPDADANLDDLAAYVATRAEPPVAREVVAAAQGNFLVATMVLDALDLGQLSAAELAEVPPGLSSVYATFFARLFPDPAAYGDARALLEVAVAAQEPLTRPQLGAICGLDPESELPAVLRRLAAFLPVREGRYAPFHRSFVEWLTDWDHDLDEPLAGDYQVVTRRGHERLAAWCEEVPDYRLRHLPTHLAGAGEHDALAALLTSFDFADAKVHGATVFDLVADLALAEATLSAAHPHRTVLALLAEAIRMDANAIARHPEALIQSSFNRGWWHDAPAAAGAFQASVEDGAAGAAPWQSDGERLADLMETWRAAAAGRRWLRARWPYPLPLGLPVTATFAGPDTSMSRVAVVSGGRGIVVADENNALFAWDVTTGMQRAVAELAHGYAASLTNTPDGAAVIAGTGEGWIVTLEPDSLAAIDQFDTGSAASLGAIAALPGGAVVTGDDENVLRAWSAPPRAELAAVTLDAPIACVAVSPGCDTIAVGSQSWSDGNSVLLVARRADGSVARVTFPHGLNGEAVLFLDDGQHLACGAGDAFGSAFVCVFEADTLALRGMLPAHVGGIGSLALDPVARRLFSAGAEEVHVWEADRVMGETAWLPVALMANTARFSADSRLLLVGTDRSELLTALDLEAVEAKVLTGHDGGIHSLAVDGDLVACGCGDGSVRLWDAREWTSSVVAGHDSPVRGVAFSAEGTLIATAAEDVRVVRLATGEELARLSTGDADLVALSPDGELLAIGGFSTVELWSWSQARRLWSIEASNYLLGFTADGAELVVRGVGSILTAHALSDGREVPVQARHLEAEAAAAGCPGATHRFRSPRETGARQVAELALERIATGEAVAWFPIPWAEAVPAPDGSTWALLVKGQLYVLSLE